MKTQTSPKPSESGKTQSQQGEKEHAMIKKPLSYALERILVLFLVTTVTITFSLLIVDFIRRFMDFPFISWILCVYMFITGGFTQVISWIFLKEKTSVFASVRFIVFYGIIAFILFMFVIPGVPAMLIVIPTVFECYFMLKLERTFSYHDSFITSCGDLSGQELSSMLHEETWLISDFVEIIDDSLFKLGILSFVTITFFLALFFTHTSISVLTVVFMLAHVILMLFTLVLSTIFKNETYYAGMGLSSVFSLRKKLLKSSFIFCLLCVAIAFFIASDYALLKPSYFAWLFAWLKGVTPDNSTQSVTGAPEPKPVFLEETSYNTMDVETNPVFEILFKIIKWISLIGLSGLVLFFFFGPFFSQKWKEFWKNKKLASYLKRIWAAIKSALRALLGIRIQKREAYAKAAADFKDKISTIIEASKKSKEKKKEIDRLTASFLEVIEWGEEREITYKKNLAPAEYTALIADAFPSAAALVSAAKTAGELFEKALYAKELLSAEEEKRFVEAVATVIKSEIA